MEKRKIVSIILGVIIIIIAVIMPFHLKQICYEHSMHGQEWSLGAWNAVQISATFYCIAISVLTLILVLINTIRKRNIRILKINKK